MVQKKHSGKKELKNFFERLTGKTCGPFCIALTPYRKTIEKDGEEQEVLVPRYKVVSTYDVNQTEGKPLPSIAALLTGSVDSYDDFMAALEQVSPVPIGFKDIPGSAYGYYSPTLAM